MTDSQQLLAEYVRNGSEAAFRELVHRYLDLVYSAAIRLVEGNAHLAQDVAQTVFVDLARTARSLSKDVMLGGWLHRHTCYVASTIMRGERRRQARERQAVEMNAQPNTSDAGLAQVGPLLDDAINQLGAEDRSAILLRFFERRDFRAIGEALGSNEDAAQKRVSRALDKLHGLLKNRGVTFSAAALGTALAAEAVTAAPAGLAVAISTSAISGAAGGGTALTLLKLMTTTKIKVALLSTVAAAAVATPAVVQYQSAAKLRGENQVLHQQAGQAAQLQAENQRLADLAAQSRNAAALTQEQMSELLKLRGEVGALRAQKSELEKVREENRLLRARLAATQTPPATQNQDIASRLKSPSAVDPILYACINNLRMIDGAKQMWALEHKATASTIPAVEDLQPYLRLGQSGTFMVCPAGGVYVINSLQQAPTCSVPGHALQ